MQKPIWLIAAFATLLLIASPAPAFARGSKKPKPLEYHDTVIESVSASSITISADKTKKTYPINQFTEVALKGRKTTVTELKPGMLVTVVAGADGVTASRISAGDLPVHPDVDGRKK